MSNKFKITKSINYKIKKFLKKKYEENYFYLLSYSNLLFYFYKYIYFDFNKKKYNNKISNKFNFLKLILKKLNLFIIYNKLLKKNLLNLQLIYDLKINIFSNFINFDNYKIYKHYNIKNIFIFKNKVYFFIYQYYYYYNDLLKNLQKYKKKFNKIHNYYLIFFKNIFKFFSNLVLNNFNKFNYSIYKYFFIQKNIYIKYLKLIKINKKITNSFFCKYFKYLSLFFKIIKKKRKYYSNEKVLFKFMLKYKRKYTNIKKNLKKKIIEKYLYRFLFFKLQNVKNKLIKKKLKKKLLKILKKRKKILRKKILRKKIKKKIYIYTNNKKKILKKKNKKKNIYINNKKKIKIKNNVLFIQLRPTKSNLFLNIYFNTIKKYKTLLNISLGFLGFKGKKERQSTVATQTLSDTFKLFLKNFFDILKRKKTIKYFIFLFPKKILPIVFNTFFHNLKKFLRYKTKRTIKHIKILFVDCLGYAHNGCKQKKKRRL